MERADGKMSLMFDTVYCIVSYDLDSIRGVSCLCLIRKHRREPEHYRRKDISGRPHGEIDQNDLKRAVVKQPR